jgi:preprotein translocase subunit SecA
MRDDRQTTPSPGALLGDYPEKAHAEPSFSANLKHKLRIFFSLFGGVFQPMQLRPYLTFVKRVAALAPEFEHVSEARIKARLRELRGEFSMHGMTDALLAEVFAIIKITCQRELGHIPYDTQLIAARIMLDGKLAEMATGEGKTLAAGLCVAAAALAGIPVHLITSNDYLVARDSATLRPLFSALGLTVGAAIQGQPADERLQAYACDITYVTAKELVFDYLRDRTIGGRAQSKLHHHVSQVAGKPSNTLLRGLCMAVVDEADSILIDEARVPLILSQSALQEAQVQYHSKVMALAAQLKLHQDFKLNPRNLSAELTDTGWQNMDTFSENLGQLKHNKLHLEESLCQALAALHLYQRDKHYLVRDDIVHIIDEITGRIAPGRIWSRGLHQLIELKEHCKPSGEAVTITQITYQRFFPRYLRLAGMSGTLSESRTELFSVFGLGIVKVPLRNPSQRITLPTRIYRDKSVLFQNVTNRVTSLSKNGQPILIGTDSVADSEVLSQLLDQAGLAHEVLNARQDQREANIVAQAGQSGQITVSTNIAGRGTDIGLGKGVAALGGIHLISCQHNVSRRIDRQLIGRSARQGQPGCAETLLAMDKPLIAQLFPKWLTKLAGENGLASPQWLVMLIVRLPQWLEESHQRQQRHEMMLHDARIERESFISN